VVVGVDGSATSLAALDLAADEAMARVAPMVVLHAVGPDERMDDVSRLVAAAVGRASAEHPGLSVDCEVVTGEPADVLVRRSPDACLLVMGHRQSRAFGELPIESAVARLVDRVEAPLIVHRPLDTSMDVPLPRPVLIGVADAGSDRMVEFAFAEAALRGAPVLAVHVWSAPGDSAPAGTHAGTRELAEAHDDAERVLTEALDRWADKYPEVTVYRAVRHSLDVPVVLTAASRAAQLVVVGSARPATAAERTAMGGGPGAYRPAMGSVAMAMVRRAGCPVAVIPERG